MLPTIFLPTMRMIQSLWKGFETQKSLIADVFLQSDASVAEFAFSGTAPINSWIMHPLSRGTIRINSTDPDPVASPPIVDFATAANPVDMQLLVLILRAERRVLGTPSFAYLQPAETDPGPNVTSDADIEAVFPCCTAAMMPRELGGVVDAELRIYGVQGLRVVDTS
jgi:choline dehydrogenase-like flavoprotein